MKKIRYFSTTLLVFLASFAFAQKVSSVTGSVKNFEKNGSKEKAFQKSYTLDGLPLEEYDYANEFYQSYAYNAQGKISKHVVRAIDAEKTTYFTYLPDMIVESKTDHLEEDEEKITTYLDKSGKISEKVTLNKREVYTYNEFDSLIGIQTYAGSGKTAKKTKRTFIEYDKVHQKRIFRADYDVNDKIVYEHKIKYNAKGQILEESERDFKFNIYKLNVLTYDENGRLTVNEFSDFKTDEHQVSTMTYFADGQICQISKVQVQNQEGKLLEYTSFEYQNGKKWRSTSYGAEKKIICYYNKFGHKISQDTYQGEQHLESLTLEYKYY